MIQAIHVDQKKEDGDLYKVSKLNDIVLSKDESRMMDMSKLSVN
jgi:hypothetical protein